MCVRYKRWFQEFGPGEQEREDGIDTKRNRETYRKSRFGNKYQKVSFGHFGIDMVCERFWAGKVIWQLIDVEDQLKYQWDSICILETWKENPTIPLFGI